MPARPTGLDIAVSGQSVTITWDNPNDSTITGYEYGVNHNDTGTGRLTGWQWTAIPNSGASTTSHTITGHTFGKEYRYKIRAVNLGGNSKPAPAAAPWYLSVTIADPRPPALSDLWTVRVCDDLFKVRWNFVPGATGYDLEMSGNHRQSWQRKMTNKNKNGWQFSQWTKNATFWFRVRAVNAHGASGWRYVKSIAPPCRVEGLQANRIPIDGQSGTITATWNPAKRASGYDVNFTADNGKSWQRMVTDLRATSYEFTKHIPYNSNYRVAVQSRRKGVTSGWTNAPVPHLIVSEVAETTATLTLTGHTAAWYYMADKTPHNTCNSVNANTAIVNLTNLTANTEYTYKAYDKTNCNSADEIASATFTTAPTPGSRDSSKDFTLDSDNGSPRGIWSNGTTMWVVDNTDDKAYAYNLTSKARDASKDISFPTAQTWQAITSDGVTVWAGNNESYTTIYAYTLATGAADTSKNITMSGGNDHAFHLWTDGVHIWVHDQLDKKIYVYNLETKLQVSSKNIDLDSSKGTYKGIWSDGTTMWVTEATTPDSAYAYTLDGGARDSTKDITLDSLNTQRHWHLVGRDNRLGLRHGCQ